MCDKSKFVQIHCHTSFSNLDGAGSTKKIVEKAKSFGHTALATTEHGSPAGLYEFDKTCRKNGIKPILGLEFYINNDLTSRVPNKQRALEDRDFHQSIYIKDKEGYKNFNYLTYVSFTDGYYYKPRIDFDLLFNKHNGLMATTSCMASKFNNYLTADKFKESEELFVKFLKTFGDDFYGEIQFNELNDRGTYGIDQRYNNDFIIKMCQKYDVPLLIGGDVHYVEPDDNVLQDAIINSKRQAKEGEEGFQIHARHLYYHDVADYYDFNKKFGYNYDTAFLEKCFENSIKFSEKVDFKFETGKYHVPKIKTEGMSSKDYLEKLSWEGIGKRIDKSREQGLPIEDSVIDAYEKQIPYELKVINDLGLDDYLLIVQDIINWEKANNIFVGPGRGSAAGSVVAYAIGITDCCPVQHDLLFERFINPNRKVMADIDWDSEMGGREKVLEYLVNTYGQESVCNVATFGLYGPKSALKDMSRGLRKEEKFDKILMKKISKLDGLEDTNDLIHFFNDVKRRDKDPEVQEWIENNQDTIKFSNKLVGQMRQLGTHAGGIVVTPEPIYNFIPVTKGSGNLLTAFSEADGSAKDLSELGILKLDVLGLKTLNVLKECVNKIKDEKGLDLSEKIYYLPLDDKKIIDFFASGNNYGIFQMDRSAMFTSRFREDGGTIDSFDDIVAINAMNRPGPLEKFLPKYGYWKAIDKGKIKLTKEELEKVDKERYPFEFMRSSLENTYGCLLYQEQFMQMIADVTGMTFGEADSFRRAIAWRPDNPKYHTVAQYFEKLENSMIEKGYTKEDVEKFVQYCRDFMGYSFNKSHSVVYSYISWQTLYFKVYYPAYFYAAMLNMEKETENIQEIIEDAKKNEIKILPLSVTKSEYLNKAEGDDAIRLGYRLISGLGDAVKDELENLQLHKCKTIEEILQKPFKKINSTTLQNIINLGCFDEFGVDRDMIIKIKDLYKEPKIEKWFSRKRNAAEEKTMPDMLKDNFELNIVLDIAQEVKEEEQPHLKLISKLTPYLKIETKEEESAKIKRIQKATIDAEMDLMGFAVSQDDDFLQFAKSMRSGGFVPISEYGEGEHPCFFKVARISEAKTKTGKTYWVYILNDGRKDFKAKVWRENKKIKAGDLAVGVLEFNEFGWTLLQCEFVK